MREKFAVVGILTAACVGFGFSAVAAEHLSTAQKRHADKNKDGYVDTREMKTWERKQDSKVDTAWENRADLNNDGRVDATEKQLYDHKKPQAMTLTEQQYDSDHNGILDSEEAKLLLQDKYALIKTNGNARVDSPIEAAYDLNKDNIIDKQEAEKLREDLRLK